MNIRLITAICPRDKLEAVESRLQVIGVERIDVSKVKGYGEQRNYYTRDWMVDEVKLDIFTRTDEVESITTAIMDGAYTGEPGDGIVALFRSRSSF